MSRNYDNLISNELHSLLDFSILELRKLPDAYAKMKSMVFSQDLLPVDIFCLPSTQRPDSVERELAWLPPRPQHAFLTKDSFAKYWYMQPEDHFVAYGLNGYVIKLPDYSLQTFCLAPTDSKTIIHPRISLSTSTNLLKHRRRDLYIYLATVAGHPLLRDTKQFGACFFIEESRKNALVVRYACSLEFNTCWRCWQQHQTNHIDDIVPAQSVPSKISIRIICGWLHSTPNKTST